MKNPSKFMPKKPWANSGNLGSISIGNLKIWWAKEIEPLFKDAVVVRGFRKDVGSGSFSEGLEEGSGSHEALLINIRPISKPKSDAELLQAILDAYYGLPGDLNNAIKQARDAKAKQEGK